jgi:ubiquinone/menaquinone biosynthesis C-methylase UbiE
MTDIPSLYQDGAKYDRMFDNTEDVAFWKQRISGADCLEICCGTGRMLLELAAAGVEAHGLDYAPAMLDEARAKAEARGLNVHLYEGDMRDFDLRRTFSTLMIISNAFVHLYTPEEAQRHLASVKRHMRVGSRYIIDLFVPRLDLLLSQTRNYVLRYIDPGDGQTVTVYEEADYDPVTQIRRLRWFYEKDGQTAWVETIPMRMFFAQELDGLLKLSGLRIVEKWGDYDASPLVNGSPKQITVCELA